MVGKSHTSRNYDLPGGVSRYSRSAMYRRKALFKKKKIPVIAAKEKSVYFRVKKIKGEKNGEKRTVPLRKSVSKEAVFIHQCKSLVYNSRDSIPRRISVGSCVPVKRPSLPGCVLVLPQELCLYC